MQRMNIQKSKLQQNSGPCFFRAKIVQAQIGMQCVNLNTYLYNLHVVDSMLSQNSGVYSQLFTDIFLIRQVQIYMGIK